MPIAEISLRSMRSRPHATAMATADNTLCQEALNCLATSCMLKSLARAVERKIPLLSQRGAKLDQERNGINGGDPELVEGEEAVAG